MKTEKLFIVPVLLDGIGTLNAAVKNIAVQMDIDDPKEVLRRINSGDWIVTEKEKKVIHVTNINRTQTPLEAIKATRRNQYLNDEVVKNIPMGIEYGESVTLEVFKPGKYQTAKQIDEWYEKEGLVPDPIALLKHLEDNPEAADSKSLAVQWKDNDGNYCYLTLDVWLDGRGVNVSQNSYDWNDDWSFVGLRKS